MKLTPNPQKKIDNLSPSKVVEDQKKQKLISQRVIMSALVALSLLTSCETEVDITAPWQNIPVVYCVLDTADPVHYIRIQRAFLGNQNAYEMAQHSDSLIYQNSLDVKLKVLNSSKRVVQTLDFQRFYIDKDSLNQHGEAIFGRENHHVYRSQDQLSFGGNYSYQLEINFPDGKRIVAENKALEDFRQREPASGTAYNLTRNSGFGPKFWAPKNAGAVKVIMHFHYYEFTAPHVYQRKTITIPVETTRVKPDAENSVTILTNDIFKKFIENIEIAPPGVLRFLGKVDFEYYIADQTFADQLFRRNAGLSGEINPVSNIDGAYGIFAWRLHVKRIGFKSSTQSRNAFNQDVELRLRGFPPAITYLNNDYQIDLLP
ncbi:MAG TPA: hypothetical protein PK990_01420 [Salinivirgaceae bacterium]|nr:hypothetical protein [Salinivirgaceae bacterium]